MTKRKIVNKLFCWFFISLLGFSSIKVSGQEMFGVTLGNYNGLTGALLNPAIMTGSKNYLEVHFVSTHLFANNDAYYIPASDLSFWDIWKDGTEFPTYGENDNNFLMYDNRNSKAAVINLRVLGPSVMYQYGNHAFGITTGARYYTTGNQIPFEMAVFGYESLKYEPLQNVNFDDYNFDAATMAWMEIGLSYAYNVYQFLDNQVTIGASVRRLWGYAGVYGEVNNLDYIVMDDSTINVKNLNGNFGFAAPVDYNTNDYPMNDPFFKGGGFGFDVGVVYTKRRYIDNKRWERPCQQRYEDYLFRIGFSILDIGRVKYKNNAQLHTLDDVSVIWQNFDTISYSNVNQVVGELSNVFYGDPDASYVGNEMKIGLPTALSLQFDYNLLQVNNVYIAAVWVHPLRFNKHTLRRPAHLSIIPRYELRHIEFNLPIMLYEYKYPRIGLSARFSFLTIGTERIGTYLGLADLNGMDIYFSLKLNIRKGFCRKVKVNECENGEYGYNQKDKARFKKRKNRGY